MGVAEEYAVASLKQTDNDVDAAAELIHTNPDLLEAVIASMLKDLDEDKKGDEDTNKKAKKRREEVDEARKRYEAECGNRDAESHLDFTFEEESKIIDKYCKLLNLT